MLKTGVHWDFTGRLTWISNWVKKHGSNLTGNVMGKGVCGGLGGGGEFSSTGHNYLTSK